MPSLTEKQIQATRMWIDARIRVADAQAEFDAAQKVLQEARNALKDASGRVHSDFWQEDGKSVRQFVLDGRSLVVRTIAGGDFALCETEVLEVRPTEDA